MESQSSPPSLLVLCGKSAVENELAESLKLNNALKLPGDDEFKLLLQSEIGDSLGNEGFRIRDYFNSLSTKTSLGRFLIYSPKLPSTHDVVSRNFCDLPVGAVCVADAQFKGRGRSNNVWESPKGSLLFSFTLQMENGRMVPHVQYIVSLAMASTINDLSNQQLEVRIKWPNDLYLNSLKVGGILCTSTYKSQKFNISAGIGINVDNEKPTTCLNSVLQKSSTSIVLKREEIMAAFFNRFESLIAVFLKRGFEPLEELYYKTWLHSGQRVIVKEERTEKQDKFVENVVTILGLSPSGYLLAITDDAQTCELHPDGNSFDFFKGLVRRKLSQ